MLGQYMSSTGFGMYGNIEYGFGQAAVSAKSVGIDPKNLPTKEMAIAAAEKRLADATIAMNKLECPGPGGSLLPAVTCKPELALKVKDYTEQLAAIKSGGSGKMKFVIGGVVLAAAVGGFLWWKSQQI